jgi:hypothetical protein
MLQGHARAGIPSAIPNDNSVILETKNHLQTCTARSIVIHNMVNLLELREAYRATSRLLRFINP